MMARLMPDGAVDVLVVGGGPAGLTAAAHLARRGFSVTVCEEHDAVGRPVHCTGVLAASAFDEFNLPRAALLNPVDTVRCTSPGGHCIEYTTPGPEAVVID